MAAPNASAPGIPARGTSDPSVEKMRAWTGLTALVAGDVAIALAAILGITHFASGGPADSQILPQVVAILSTAFTAIGTMTTAYFGIKSISNTAQKVAETPTAVVPPPASPGHQTQ